jgi:hypothetical protein
VRPHATVRSIVRRYDSLELLGRLFVEHCLCDPTTYEESTAAHNEVWLEYVHSALVATPPSELEWLAPDEACLAQLNEALEGIYLGGVVALILEPVDKPRLEFESLRVKQRLQNLGVRGDSYQEHHWDLVSFVVNAAGALLQEKCGVSSEAFAMTFRAAQEQV